MPTPRLSPTAKGRVAGALLSLPAIVGAQTGMPAASAAPPASVAAPQVQAPSGQQVVPATPAAPAIPAVSAPAPHAFSPPPAPAPIVAAPRAPLPPAPPPPPLRGLPPDAPRLVVSGGMYSENPALRRLIVNGNVVTEGAELGAGVRLEQIGPANVVLAFRGRRYDLAY